MREGAVRDREMRNGKWVRERERDEGRGKLKKKRKKRWLQTGIRRVRERAEGKEGNEERGE